MISDNTYRFDRAREGDVFTFAFPRGDTQDFRISAITPYVTRAGKPSAIITWLGWCSSCGAEFTFDRGMAGRIDVRRCQACIPHRRQQYLRRRRR